MSHYDTLGVSKSATPEEIKKAYRKLASQHHPDKGGDTAKFQQIEEAYRVLSDPAQRQQYDNPQPQGFHFNFNGSDIDGMDMHDIFRNFGFGGGSPFGQRHPRKNKDLQIEINIQLHETLEQQERTVSVMTTNGSREVVNVSIPVGVVSGTAIKYSGLGDNLFNTLQRGDLYVRINVIPNPKFRTHNLDLITKAQIDCFTAITGGELEVTGLDGKIFVITVHPGCQPGSMLRIKGQGLFEINTRNRGNLLVEISVTIPTHLSEDQLNLVKQIQNGQ